MSAAKAYNREATTTVKPPTTFLSLPAELRNYIYNLSGCLQVIRCGGVKCRRAATRDVAERYTIICHERKSCYEEGCRHRCFTKSGQYTFIHSDLRGESRGVLCADLLGNRTRVGASNLFKVISVPTPAQQPALTKVSRTIRNETLPMFYGQNTFVISTRHKENAKEITEKFLKMIGPSNTALLRELVTNIRHFDFNCNLKGIMRNRYICSFGKSFPELRLRPSAFSIKDNEELQELTGRKT